MWKKKYMLAQKSVCPSSPIYCTVGTLECFPKPTTNSLILRTPTEYSAVQFNFDTSYPELVHTPKFRAQSHKTAPLPASDTSCMSWRDHPCF